MPIYEYRCLECQKRFSVSMTYQEYGKREVACPHCQGNNIQRRIGRIRVARSEESCLDDMGDPSQFAGLEDDPRAMGRLMRKMSDEVGEDMGPEFDEVINRLEKGQSPEEIERELPELGMGEEGTASAGDFDDGIDF